MEQVATDDQLRANLIQRGVERNRAFSWDKSAQQFWDVILKFDK
jgi:glycosyltransferase involved in cell wall biosynthesis